MIAITARWLSISATCLVGSALALAACGDDNIVSPDAAPPDTSVPRIAKVTRTDLVSDTGVAGVTTDPNLVNPWGIAFNPAGPIWVSDNGTGLATVYDSTGAILPLVVSLPTPAGDHDPATPSGQNFNPFATDFKGDVFILTTEDGTILGWQSGTTAVMRVDNSASGAVYKGFDIVDTAAGRVIVAANFGQGQLDLFDANYNPITLANGAFVDPSPLPGFAPFNVLVVGSDVYVSYAKQDAQHHDDVAGPGNGAIDVFDQTGRFMRRVTTGDTLNSPWGMAIAPSDYPVIGGNLIVGNFGDGHVSAFDTTTDGLAMLIDDNLGNNLTIPGLWALRFGQDVAGESHLQMFFSAGPDSETHGVLGRLDISQ